MGAASNSGEAATSSSQRNWVGKALLRSGITQVILYNKQLGNGRRRGARGRGKSKGKKNEKRLPRVPEKQREASAGICFRRLQILESRGGG